MLVAVSELPPRETTGASTLDVLLREFWLLGAGLSKGPGFFKQQSLDS